LFFRNNREKGKDNYLKDNHSFRRKDRKMNMTLMIAWIVAIATTSYMVKEKMK
jgi:hypothetical protein